MDRTLADDTVVQHLMRGERIVWRQRAPALRLAARRMPALGFCLVWAGFSWTWTAIAGTAMTPVAFAGDLQGAAAAMPFMFVAIGVMFSLVGVSILWAALTDLARSWSTHYVLTGRRLMIVAGDNVESFDASAFGKIASGRGVVSFAWGPVGRSGAGFGASLLVDEPRRVEEMIREALRPPAP